MSIWINKRSLVGLALLIPFLAGCVAPEGGALGTGSVNLQRRAVLAGAITVASPTGYCIDPKGVIERGDGVLVLIGRCQGTGRAPAILSVAVSAAGTGVGLTAESGPELAAFFQSRPGRAALSRSGKPDRVQVLEMLVDGDAFLVRMNDSSPDPHGPVQAESWRAVLGLSGRLVTLSVAGAASDPLDRAAGRKLLGDFLRAMRAANRSPKG